MNKEEQAKGHLKEIFRKVFCPNGEKLTDMEIMNAEFGRLSGWDSINHLHFVLEVERVFSLERSPEHLFEFVSYAEVLRFLLNEKR